MMVESVRDPGARISSVCQPQPSRVAASIDHLTCNAVILSGDNPLDCCSADLMKLISQRSIIEQSSVGLYRRYALDNVSPPPSSLRTRGNVPLQRIMVVSATDCSIVISPWGSWEALYEEMHERHYLTDLRMDFCVVTLWPLWFISFLFRSNILEITSARIISMGRR